MTITREPQKKMAQNSLPNQYIPKRVSIFTAPGDSDMNTIENYDGSITKMRSREICNENGSKRTEIKRYLLFQIMIVQLTRLFIYIL